jgi:hypothetical protein
MKTCIRCNIEYETKSKNNMCSVCKNGLSRYGLDRKQQIELLEKQKQSCKLCDAPLSLHQRKRGYKHTGNIDHCHTTNAVRGILCHPCNVTLGYLENKKINLDRLKEYASVSTSATNGE